MATLKTKARRLMHATTPVARRLSKRSPIFKALFAPTGNFLLRLLKQNIGKIQSREYEEWRSSHAQLTPEGRSKIKETIQNIPNPVLISVVMPTYNTPENLLREAIKSVQDQLYPHWELCIADDASPSSHVAACLAEMATSDPRIRWVRRERNGHISAASNSALALAQGEWVVLMDHDDLLDETALYEVSAEAMAFPQAQVIYSDEDKVDEKGRFSFPYFKPDFDPDLLTGQNFVSHLGAYRRDLLQRIGGFREGYEGSQDHDLILRAALNATPEQIRHIPRVLYHWRHQANTASFSEASLERCIKAAEHALNDYLVAKDVEARVERAPNAPDHFRVIYPLPKQAPMVTVIIPTLNQSSTLENCLSTLLQMTDYRAFEIILSGGQNDQQKLNYSPDFLKKHTQIRFLSAVDDNNLSKFSNMAAHDARGDVLIFLDEYIEVIEKSWMNELTSQAIRPEIGAVGGKLLFENATVKYAGAVLGGGPDGISASIDSGADKYSPGYLGRLALVRSTSVVTSSCLAVRKETYFEVGGFDEDHFPTNFRDVDFCLRLIKAGYRNIFTPFAEFFHSEAQRFSDHENANKSESFARDLAAMRQRWGIELEKDSYWNPNLSRDMSGRLDSRVS